MIRASSTVSPALDLSEKQPEFAAKGVKLVGVVHEKLGVEEFSGFFKNGEIYFDEQKAFFNGECGIETRSHRMLTEWCYFYFFKFVKYRFIMCWVRCASRSNAQVCGVARGAANTLVASLTWFVTVVSHHMK